jgi:hypothetical protein
MRRQRPETELDLGDGAFALDMGDALDMDDGPVDIDLGERSLDTGEPPAEEKLTHASYEEMHTANVAEIKTAFMQRAADDKARFLEATDSEFWVCHCFRSREQKEAYLRGLAERFGVDVEELDKYIHGEDVAKALGIELPPARFVPPGQKVNKDMVRLGLIGGK